MILRVTYNNLNGDVNSYDFNTLVHVNENVTQKILRAEVDDTAKTISSEILNEISNGVVQNISLIDDNNGVINFSNYKYLNDINRVYYNIKNSAESQTLRLAFLETKDERN